MTVFARNAAAGMALAQGAGARWGGALDQVPAAGPFAAVVNATSVGMAPGPDVSPVAPEAFGPGVLAYDLVYAPVETRFLRDARARGAETLDGLVHLAAQARGQLELWLGAERVAALPDGFLRQQAR